VTLRRGIIGSLNLYQWLDQIRNGDAGAYRTVLIQLQNEDHTAVVMTWKLFRARIIKHTSGPFNAKGTDVAMEELTLAYERLEME
jgi:phage tail-like protein